MKKLKKLKKTNVFIHLNKRLGLLSQSKQVFFYVDSIVCLHSLFQNLYPVGMALSSFWIFLRVSTCWNLHSRIIIVINISAKYSFTILEINISNVSTFCKFGLLYYSVLCSIRPFVNSVFCHFGLLSHSVLCSIRSFVVRSFVIRSFVIRSFVIRSFVATPDSIGSNQ